MGIWFCAKCTLERHEAEIQKLQQKKKSIQQVANKAERGRKKAEQENKSALVEYHRKKKITPELSIEREKVFKRELQQLEYTHKDKLPSAFALLDQATEKYLASESGRIISEK